eukprot:5009229-Pleurochrysis_carterae.AAC.1
MLSPPPVCTSLAFRLPPTSCSSGLTCVPVRWTLMLSAPPVCTSLAFRLPPTSCSSGLTCAP